MPELFYYVEIEQANCIGFFYSSHLQFQLIVIVWKYKGELFMCRLEKGNSRGRSYA